MLPLGEAGDPILGRALELGLPCRQGGLALVEPLLLGPQPVEGRAEPLLDLGGHAVERPDRRRHDDGLRRRRRHGRQWSGGGGSLRLSLRGGRRDRIRGGGGRGLLSPPEQEQQQEHEQQDDDDRAGEKKRGAIHVSIIAAAVATIALL